MLKEHFRILRTAHLFASPKIEIRNR